MKYSAADEKSVARIRASFAQQGIMHTIGGILTKVEPGEVHIHFPFSKAIRQQHGFVDAGILTTVVDSACGYASSTLMPRDSEVLTVEYKVNFMSPARGADFYAIGRVVKPGRTITVCTGEVMVKDASDYKTIALIQATMMAILK